MQMSTDEAFAHIRKRPGMYLGSNGPHGVFMMVLEVVSNSFDQVIAGRASRIDVTIGSDRSVTIADDGLGIQLDAEHPDQVETYFTSRRDVPTADGHWPHVHLSSGIGLGPISALSAWVDVEVRRADGTYRQTFERGAKASELGRSAPRPDGVTGTIIQLLPDPVIFGDAQLDPDLLAESLRELAHLEPGLVTTLAVGDRPTEVFGPVADLAALFRHTYADERSRTEPDPPMLLSAAGTDFAVDVALGWSRHRYKVAVRSYGNYRLTDEGGHHVDGIEEGLREVFGQGPMRDRNGLMAGLRAVVHVRLLDPKFPGPTRRRLASPEAIWCVADVIAQQLPATLADHPELAASLQMRCKTRTNPGYPDPW